ncbi:MAG: hypothetical protein Q8Q30_00735 [Candidatus Woesebacteria bacterium]|nr:hypothetical protein [Candidatus Woesebacteria bacterium]
MSKQITYEEFRYYFKKAFDEVIMPVLNRLKDDHSKKVIKDIKTTKSKSPVAFA